MNMIVTAKKIAWLSGLLLMLGVTVAAYGFPRTSEISAACSGTVLCPLTGEEVCKDLCPLLDADRADCPGKVECPLTGEPVCRDECPLIANESSVVASEELPACCREKQ